MKFRELIVSKPKPQVPEPTLSPESKQALDNELARTPPTPVVADRYSRRLRIR